MSRFSGLVSGPLCLFVIGIGAATTLRAQDYSRGYDPLAAGEDAYRYHEARRQGDIANQLGLINEMKWYSGIPYANGYGTSVYYRDPPSLDYVYATGRRSAYGYGAWGRGLTPLYGGGYFRDVFSPWPYVPGDIYGYQTLRTAPQSIGQRQIQTGPNRWESHPIYAEPPAEAALVAEPAVRRDTVHSEVPRETPRRRPREF